MAEATAERLEQYGGLSWNVIDNVSEFAERQSRFETYGDFFKSVGIRGVERVVNGRHASEVVDIKPADYDPEEAIVVHLPFLNPLDKNQLYQVGTIAGTNPDKRVIAFGRRCGGYDSGRLGLKDRWAVAHGNLNAMVEPSIRYIDEKGIGKTQELGNSFGCDTALVQAARGNHEVSHCVTIENASVDNQKIPVIRLLKLVTRFASSEKALQPYVDSNNLPTFQQARDNSMTDLQFYTGLVMPTNIAVAKSLARGGADKRYRAALEARPDMLLANCWGSRSELALDGLSSEITRELQDSYGDRVRVIRLQDQKHALSNDLHLQAALFLEGTRMVVDS